MAPEEAPWRLAHARQVKKRVLAAQAVPLPREVLAVLVNDASRTVRRVLAGRDDLHAWDLLRPLAHDDDLRTREALAANPACPAEILLELVNDQHWSVRWNVASRWLANWPTTPREILEILLQDENEEVASQAEASLRNRRPHMARGIRAGQWGPEQGDGHGSS